MAEAAGAAICIAGIADIAGNACAPNPPTSCIAGAPIIDMGACIIGTAVSTIVGVAVGTI